MQYRKAVGDAEFIKTDLSIISGYTPCSVSCGKMGIFMIARSSLIVFRSIDDGLNWTIYTFTNAEFKDHTHCVWADSLKDFVYVSGGDDGVNGTSGVYRSTDFATWTQVYAEKPGERIVPITGNQRKRFFGLEGSSCGVLATYDDVNYEMAVGRRSLSYLNFDCLIATDDGLLIGGGYQYGTTPYKYKGRSCRRCLDK